MYIIDLLKYFECKEQIKLYKISFIHIFLSLAELFNVRFNNV